MVREILILENCSVIVCSLHLQTEYPYVAKRYVLHLGAVSAIASPGELRDYYLRKVDQGKHKMKVINNVRNKLVQRVYACVKNDRIYQKNYNVHLT